MPNMTKTMKSAIYLGKRDVRLCDVPIPECGDNDILVRNIYSSICGTDVAVYLHGPGTGHRITPGGEFGHETVSEVMATGKNITDVAPGARIYPYPLYAKDDTSRAGTLGGFSEYMLLPNAKKDHSYYLVDDAIPSRIACLIEPFTVGGRAAKQSCPQPGEKAIVFGAGTIGLAAAIMLKFLGVDDVLVCDMSTLRLEIAGGLGFETRDNSAGGFMDVAGQVFGSSFGLHGKTANIDIWVDAAGADSILDDFLARGKIGSRFVAVAVNNASRNIDMLDLTYSSQAIIGSGGYRPQDVTDVMAIMKSGRWDLGAIITDEYPIERICDALDAASDPERHLNVILHF